MKWKTQSAGNAGKFWIVDDSGKIIAEIPNTTSETDRELMAAAPELLAVCRRLTIGLFEEQAEACAAGDTKNSPT